MRNPLIKRLPKELKSDFGKYLVIFLFMIATIGFISGFLVADNSMVTAYNNSFEKYNIEDGNFECEGAIDNKILSKIEDENELELYKNYYKEENVSSISDSNLLRIFVNREKLDKVCVIDGKLPDSDKTIAIDRMYADNNKIKIGDEITVGNKQLEVTGLVALSDYSALFSNNSDMMFDAMKFGVAIMTKEGFDIFPETKMHYNYAWKYNNSPEDDKEAKSKAEDFMGNLNKKVILKDYVPAYTNQAIHFAGNDMGNDKAMVLTLLYIVIVILAFVFAITTSNTIMNESQVIGTLRASGYSKGELIRHYLTMPIVVSIISSIIGNILGYTVFKNIIANIYYRSYSLTTYETIWNSEAFVLTTIVPLLIMIIINLAILIYKLSLSPLKFLRSDLKRREKKKAIRLPKFKFINRFRLRIIFQNMSGYLMLVIGIIFANILLLFGMMMTPLLDHYQDGILDNMIAKHQYILKVPEVTTNKNAEKFAMTSLETTYENSKTDEISIYGIEENSKFIDCDFKDDGVYISDGIADKYNLKVGDSIKLKEKYGDEKYNFDIKGIYKYPSTLTIFMSRSQYNKVFNKDKENYNGYFSNELISDFTENNVATEISEEDLTKTSRQLKLSMGDMFILINVIAIALYMILIYLLCKLIIEKNTTSISMLKILGYNDKEVSKLYLLSNTIVVILATLISLPISFEVIKVIYSIMMTEFAGWLTFYIEPSIYLKMFIMGICAYVVIAFFEYRKIKKVPMAEALKNRE